MADKTTPFVINDRRKFTSEGDVRPGYEPPPVKEVAPEPEEDISSARLIPEPIAFPSQPAAEGSEEPAKHAAGETIAFPSSASSAPDSSAEPEAEFPEDQMPPAPTAEQSEQAARAYQATVDRLDTAICATNPGMERIPDMSFDRFVQSLYMQAIMQLGGAAEPGQQPQVDILGARQTIDMLAIMTGKTSGNLSPSEDTLLQSALFEARMAFLEITQALARQAATRQPSGPGAPGGAPAMPGGPSGPRVVR